MSETPPPRGDNGRRLMLVLSAVGIATVVYFGLGCWILPTIFGETNFAGRVLGSWVNLFSLLAFFVAAALLIDRGQAVRETYRSLGRFQLPGDGGRLATPNDAKMLRRDVNELSEIDRRPLPISLLQTALSRSKASWKTDEVASAVMNQAEIARVEADTSYGVIRYLAWAIPSIGFVGTVLGVGEAMVAAGGGAGGGESAIAAASRSLGVAFDTTFVSLVLSLALMYLLYRSEAREDKVNVDSVSWVLNGFVNQMYDTGAEQ